MNGHSLVVVVSPGGSAAAERSEGEPAGEPKRSARPERNPLAEENQKLRRQNARLTEDLRKAQLIIDVQKEVAALLGSPLPDGAGSCMTYSKRVVKRFGANGKVAERGF